MPTISDTEINSILEISALAVECANEAHFPPALMREMTELFGSKSCVFYTMTEDLDNHPIWDGFGYNVGAAPVKQYETRYRTFDPCFAGLRRRAAAGRPLVVSTDQVIANERSYVASGYYRDFLYPQHIHNSIIFAVGDTRGLLGLFGFHRAPGKPGYAAGEHLKARLFAAQMAGALRLKKLSDDHARLRALVKKLMQRGAIRDYVVIDQHWHVIDSAGAAVNLLKLHDNLHIVDESQHRLSFRLPKEIKTHLLEQASRYRAAGESRSGPGDAHRIFDGIPGWPRVLVDLLDLDAMPPLFLLAFLDQQRELVAESRFAEFAITPREREIVHKVSRGLTTVQIADQLQISEKTVEHHLDHIYRKTGTHNRTALIYRLSR